MLWSIYLFKLFNFSCWKLFLILFFNEQYILLLLNHVWWTAHTNFIKWWWLGNTQELNLSFTEIARFNVCTKSEGSWNNFICIICCTTVILFIGNEVLLSGYSAYIMSHRRVTISNVSEKSKSSALQCN